MRQIIRRLKAFFGHPELSVARQRRFVPLLEALETRDLPSTLSATAYVNLIDGPNTQTSHDGSSVSASATGLGSASASASDFQLFGHAFGSGGLIYSTSGSASGSWSFQILGVPQGTPVPLDFSYETSLSTDVVTPPPMTSPPPRIVADVLVSYDVSAGSAEQKGLEQFTSQDGSIVYQDVVGDVGGSHVLSATFTGSGLLFASVDTIGSQDARAISSVADAGFEVTGVTSPLAAQYPDLTLQFDDGQTMPLGTITTLKDNGPAAGTPGNIQAGEPIDIGTGNVYQTNADYSGAGTDSLSFARYYNSYTFPNDAATTLGERWRSTYDRYLYVSSPTSVTVERETGQVLSFTFAGGVWRSDSDVDYTLTHSGSTWTVTDPQDNVETYADAGSGLELVTTIKARDGYTQTLQYNATDQLASVTDSYGRALTFAYQNGLLSTLTTPDGQVISYGFGFGGPTAELTSVTYPATQQTSLSYDYYTNGLLKDVIDPDGNTYVSYLYDGQNRATEVYMGGSLAADSVTVAYNADGSRTVTDASGLTTMYEFSVLQGVPKVTEIIREPSDDASTTSSYTYDANGYIASYADWNGNVTQYTNDSRGLPVSITEAPGTPLARTTTISYLPNYHLPAQVVAPGLTTDFTYDASGNLLSQTEIDTTTQTVPYSTNGEQHTWTYTYDALGHVLTATGPRTDVKDTTIYTYDTAGNLSTVTDALLHVTRITRYNARGLPLSMTDANGVVTTLAYDAMGRLFTSTVATATGNAVTRYGYDAAGLLRSVTRPDNSVLYYTYDTAQRLIGVSDPAGESITYTLDSMGNIVRQDIQNSSGAIVETQSQVFNQLNEMIQSLGALPGEVTSYTYDPNGDVKSITDPLGHSTTQAFDALNRLVSVTDVVGGIMQYGYDAQDNNVSVTTPRNLTTSYIFNGFGQVIQATSPDTGTTVYHLDAAGNVVSETDARGIVANQTFDALNRLTSVTYPSTPAGNVAYTYDSTTGGNKGITRLTGFTDESGQTTLKYDELGDVTVVTQLVGSQEYTTDYAYNLAGNITRITYPSGLIVNYSYDGQGRVSGVTMQADSKAKLVTLASEVTYEPFGPLASFTYGNGLVMTRSFDADYRVTGINTKSATTTVQNLSLGYDLDSNVTAITDHLTPSDSQTFTYDALNRLLTAAGAYPAISYTYDADSNRLTSTQGGATQNYSYSVASDQLLAITSSTGTTERFTYTADGNIATDIGGGQHAVYTYSAANRLAGVNTARDSTASYFYDALGERVTETAAKVITDFTYDQSGHLIAESNGRDGRAIQQYVWLGNLPLAQIGKGGKIYYIESDQTNTPQTMTNAEQKVVWDREQQPFGETLSTKAHPTDVLRFPGQIADAASGLNYNMMRDYDPKLGRYIEADPSALAGGINLYGYAQQSPLNATDPSGENPLLLGLVGFAAFGAAALFPEQANAPTTSCDPLYHNYVDEGLLGTTAALAGEGAFGGLLAEESTVDLSATLETQEAYHYTFEQAISSIERNGLRQGTYVTPAGDLSPIQAQIDLALAPNRGLPNAVVRVDLAGLRNAGYDIPGISQVGRDVGMPGGGYELQFPYPIPPEFITVVR